MVTSKQIIYQRQHHQPSIVPKLKTPTQTPLPKVTGLRYQRTRLRHPFWHPFLLPPYQQAQVRKSEQFLCLSDPTLSYPTSTQTPRYLPINKNYPLKVLVDMQLSMTTYFPSLEQDITTSHTQVAELTSTNQALASEIQALITRVSQLFTLFWSQHKLPS